MCKCFEGVGVKRNERLSAAEASSRLEECESNAGRDTVSNVFKDIVMILVTESAGKETDELP
jgi:hypothetical protein